MEIYVQFYFSQIKDRAKLSWINFCITASGEMKVSFESKSATI